MKDHFQELDELLKHKSFEELKESDKGLLAHLGIDPEEYEWLRQSKMVLQNHAAETKPNAFEELDQAFQEEWPTSSLWERMYHFQIPLWQAIAAVAVLTFGLSWYTASKTDVSISPTIRPPVVLCQTDTVFQEFVKTDTIYLPVKTSSEKSIKKKAMEEVSSPPVAVVPSSPKAISSLFSEVTRLEDVNTNKSGSSIKEHPDLEVFFTESTKH